MHGLNTTQRRNYAKILVHFSLNSGTGIRSGETVLLTGSEITYPLYMEVFEEIIRSGGTVIHNYLPKGFDRFGVNPFLAKYGKDSQLMFAPNLYYKGLLNSIQHHIVLLADDVKILPGTAPGNSTKIMSAATENFFNPRNKKCLEGKMSWVMALYGTSGLAKKVGLTKKEYWDEIIKACYLDDVDPVERWRNIQLELGQVRKALDAMQIKSVRIEALNTDIVIPIGKNRKWLAGSGRNLPSFEVFTTPDWRGVNGYMSFSEPLNYLGTRISGIEISAKNGILRGTATENNATFQALLQVQHANMLGEFSMTDSRHSRISKFMGTTLYDENTGGNGNGNTHVALGRCFYEAFTGGMERHIY